MVKLDLWRSVLVKCRMPFLPLLIIYLLWRILFLIFVHPLNLVVYAEEELYRGMIGREILEGLKIALYNYRADDYSGGSLLIGVLASAFFKIFGVSLFSLKLIPVCLFGGALASWYFWLIPYYGRRFASCFTLLMIFSPYLFTRFVLTALGDHPETIFFTAASLFFFFKTLDTSRPRWIYPAALGLLSGIALWMAYIYAVTLLTIGIYWALRDRSFWRKKTFAITAGFFLLGFTPWLYGNLYNHFQGLTIQGMGFFELFHWKFFLRKLWNFRTSSPYLLFAVHQLSSVVPEFPAVPVMRFYRIMFLAPMLFFAWKSRHSFKKIFVNHSPAHFAVLYLLLFLLLTQATEYREVRYFIPVQPFIFFLALYSLEQLSQKFRSKQRLLLQGLYVGLLMTVSVTLHARTVYPEFAGAAFSIKPYSFEWFLLSPVCNTPEKCLQTYKDFKNKEQLDSRDLFLFQSGVAQKLLEEMPFQIPAAELLALKERSPSDLHRYMDYYFGYETWARHDQNLMKTFAILKDTPFASPESHYWAALGVFRYPFPLTPDSPDLNAYKSLMIQIPLEAHPVLWYQAGFQWMEYTCQNSRDFDTLLVRAAQKSWELPEEYRDYFLEGVGGYLYLDWYLKPYRKDFSFGSLRGLPDKISRSIVRGAGVGLAQSQNFFQEIFFKMFELRLTPEYRIDFEEGFRRGSVFIKDFHQGYP